MITAAIDVMLGFPGLLLALLAVALFGVGATAPIVALAIAYTPYFARLTRAIARKEKSRTVRHCAAGTGLWRLPGRGPAHGAEHDGVDPGAGGRPVRVCHGRPRSDLLSGSRVQPPTPDWGNMVASGQSGVLEGEPQVALSAGLFIVLTVIALNFVAEAIAARTTAELS